jgi:hypothetical protein
VGYSHDRWPGRLDRRLGDAIAKVLAEDDEWGTTTMRPRLLTWLRSFTSAAGRSGVLPGLRVLASGLHVRLSARWPEAVIADYPALARPGSAQVKRLRAGGKWETAGNARVPAGTSKAAGALT